MPIEDKPAYRIAEWCDEARVSPAFYYKEKRNGRGPESSNAGRCTIINELPRAYYKRLRAEALRRLQIEESADA